MGFCNSMQRTWWFILCMLMQTTTSHPSGFAKDGSLPSLKSAQQAVLGGSEEIKRFKGNLRQRCETSAAAIDENVLTMAGDRLSAPTVFSLRIGKAAVMVSVSYNDILKATGHGTGLLFWQSPALLCALVGRSADCLAAKRMLSKFDEEALERTGQRMSAAQLSLCLADDAHDRSVESGMRPLAYNALVIGRDRNNVVTTTAGGGAAGTDELVPRSVVRRVHNVGVHSIFKIDVSGNFLRCQGAAVGRMGEEVEKWLRTRGAYLAAQGVAALDGTNNSSDSSNSMTTSSRDDVDADDAVGVEDAELQLCLRVAQSCLTEVFGGTLLVAEARSQPLALVTLSTGVVKGALTAAALGVDGEARGGVEPFLSESDSDAIMTSPVAVNCTEVFNTSTGTSIGTSTPSVEAATGDAATSVDSAASGGGASASDGNNELWQWWRMVLRQRRTRRTSR